MNPQGHNPKLRKLLMEMNDGNPLIFLQGFDHCIIGVTRHIGAPARVAYCVRSVLNELVEQGLTEEQAIDYFEENLAGVNYGDLSPAFTYVAPQESPVDPSRN